MKGTTKPKGFGMAAAGLLATLLIAAVIVPAIAGEITGALVEPVGFMIPGGKASSVGKAVAKGFGIGATYGGLGYVEDTQTRLGNTLLGGTIGATINTGFHGVRNIFARKASQKARKDIEKLEKYWAEEMLKDPKAAAIANSQKKKPSIVPSPDVYAQRAMKRMWAEPTCSIC